jgi:hypothetical protein
VQKEKIVYNSYNKSASNLLIDTRVLAAGGYQLLVINKDGTKETISIIK